ncbi:MAG: type VI secretion system tip protein VgrG [Burkholderiaceae bacterium]|nr:type VI secretion system tip protein VgrG [Burkholderiaceae bacterium]
MSVVTVTVTSNGQAVDPAAPLLALDVRHEINRVPVASLLYLDGNAADGSWPLSEAGTFALGAEVQIKARYEADPGSEALLFSGIVARQAIEADGRGTALRVELRHPAVRLTRQRRQRVFVDVKDSDVVKTLLGDAGLATGSIDATTLQHAQLVQQGCSDWDFLLLRAEAMGQVLALDDQGLSWRKPALGQGKLKLEFGIDDIVSLDLELDGLDSRGAARASAWDAAQQARVQATGASGASLAPGSLSRSGAAQALSLPELDLSGPGMLSQSELQAWADGVLSRAGLSLVRGCIGFRGTGKLRLLDTVELAGMGQRYNGQGLVCGVQQVIDAQGWLTTLSLGLSAQPRPSSDEALDRPAAGLLPALGQLRLAVVLRTHEDPAGQFRVQVQLSGMPDDQTGLWARVLTPDAGKGRGWCLRPEVGDEVLVGFVDADPRQPVVLGSLHSSKQAPPAAVFADDSANALRGWVTRSGLTLALDDDKKIIGLRTPAGHQLTLDDDAKAIRVADSHGNELVMDDQGVRIKSAKDLVIEASGKLTLQGSQIEMK